MIARFAASLPALAALLEVCPSARVALRAWAGEIEDEVIRPALQRVGRRIEMGAPIEICLKPLEDVVGGDGRTLGAAFEVHALNGGPLGPVVDGIARALAMRATMHHQRSAAAAASRLSGRMMALLACIFVILLPAWGRGSIGLLAACVAVAGVLMTVGLRWMRRLTPHPPPDDPVAGLADIVGSLVAGGLPLHAALGMATVALGKSDVESHLIRAATRVELGATWPRALAHARHPDLEAFGRLVERAQRFGVPAGAALTGFAGHLREQRQRDFELKARRASVMLVLPLTLCLLPAFAILVVVPLLRSLAA